MSKKIIISSICVWLSFNNLYAQNIQPNAHLGDAANIAIIGGFIVSVANLALQYNNNQKSTNNNILYQGCETIINENYVDYCYKNISTPIKYTKSIEDSYKTIDNCVNMDNSLVNYAIKDTGFYIFKNYTCSYNKEILNNNM